MTIGSGMIAKRFACYDKENDFTVFASGVSNSKNTIAADYEREINLLSHTITHNEEKHLIYFSTCSIDDPSENKSAYVQHKLKIEDLIKEKVINYNIFRVSNVVGVSANFNTIVNYYIYHIRNGLNFDVWQHAERNLIDLDDVFAIVDDILKKNLLKNLIINVANTNNYNVVDIVKSIEFFLHKRANYLLIERGTTFKIDTSIMEPIAKNLQLDFNENYLENMLEKYYSK